MPDWVRAVDFASIRILTGLMGRDDGRQPSLARDGRCGLRVIPMLAEGNHPTRVRRRRPWGLRLAGLDVADLANPAARGINQTDGDRLVLG